MSSPAAVGPVILLAEDEDEVRRLVGAVLRGAGFEVVEACGGADALDRLQGPAAGLRLLITDVAMPGMSGLELARRIAAIHPAVSILFISGYSDPEAAADAIELCARAEYLRKPFGPRELLARVRGLLG
ncbi:MAG TPA: response regulator [Terriglobales bacterium]|nr:response regulator [Terriglobales bacterium]